MDKPINDFEFRFNLRSPLVAVALHSGHLLADEVVENIFIKESERIQNEEPYTHIFTYGYENRIIVKSSRYQVDLDLPREDSYYEEDLLCEDRYKIRHNIPAGYEVLHSHKCHDRFYEALKTNLHRLLQYFNSVLLLDFHSFSCYDLPAPEHTPDIIIGISNTSQIYYPLAVSIVENLQNQKYDHRYLDVRINYFLKGGYFSNWIKENYGNSACCITLNINKSLFMDHNFEYEDEQKAEKIISILDNLKELLHKKIMYTYGSSPII